MVKLFVDSCVLSIFFVWWIIDPAESSEQSETPS